MITTMMTTLRWWWFEDGTDDNDDYDADNDGEDYTEEDGKAKFKAGNSLLSLSGETHAASEA